MHFRYLFIYFLILFSTISCDKTGTGDMDPPEPDPIFDVKMPYIEINTLGNAILDEPKSNATLRSHFIENDSIEILDYSGNIGIELRGSSSQLFDKKSYGLETRDANNMDLDTSIYGMPNEEDWILYGPYSDKSLIRNVLIYEISNEMGRYASRTQLCELYIDDDYKGVYVFMEKLKRDKERIAINKLKPDEIDGENLTGGYIIKIDKASGNGGSSNNYTSYNSFSSAYDTEGQNASFPQTYFLYDYPDEDDIALEQRTYITNYIGDFEDALAGPNYTDPELGYQKYIDVESFVDFFILNEFSHNPDAYRLSTYMYKDKNEKLTLGPIWDFNLAFGNSDFCNGGEPNNWVYKYNSYCPNDAWLVTFWWKRLLSDPFFSGKVKARYQELRGSVLDLGAINAKIDDHVYSLEISGASFRNFKKFKILNSYVWPNRNVGGSYEQEIKYLKSWITQRINWMDANVPLL